MLTLLCVGAPAPAATEAKPAASQLQAAVDRAMQGQRGTAVVLDVSSGKVLASYRLEVAAQRLAYPGSSLKPFTLLALLQSGKVDAQTKLACKRPLTIAGRRLDCSHPVTPQPLDPAEALAYSCNSYFTSVATRLTPAQLRESLIKDGLESATGLAPKEAVGTVALASTPEQLQLQAIGEWGVRVTPLELLAAYRKLALLASDSDPKLAPLFAGLQGSTEYGMGRLAQPAGVAFRVAGKTGTSQAEDGAWTHAWFAGFAPASKPEIVLGVFLEKGKGGGDAATVAREIFTTYLNNSTGAQH